MRYLAVRSPLIEWALRRAVTPENRIEVRSPVEVTGLRVEGGRVVDVEVGDAFIGSRFVVDALGRRTRTPD